MNHKTKIITSAAAAFGLAVGTAGIIGYRNIDEQWLEFETQKQQTELQQTQTQSDLTSQKASISQREENVKGKLEQARKILTDAQNKRLAAGQETITARELESKSQQALNETLKKQSQLQASQQHLDETQQLAERMLTKHRKARNLADNEITRYKNLQSDLTQTIKVTKAAEARAKKAESTTVWYQNKAKKLITQAECDISDANKTHQQALAIRAKAERVFHKIDKLEDLLDEADDAYGKLEKDHRQLGCELNDLRSNHRSTKGKIHKLKKLNSDHCTTIQKQKSVMDLLRRDTKKAEQLRQLEKANADKFHRLAKEYKSHALKARDEAKQQKSIVAQQQEQIRTLQQALKNVK